MRGRGASISRRGAMRLLGATPLAAGVALSPAGVAWSAAGGALGQEPAPPSPLPAKPYWIVRPDGSFDLVTPGVRLRSCYPAFDGVPLRVVSVKVGAGPRGTEAIYRLADGGLVILRFRETEGTLVLGTFLRKMGNAPFSVQPLLGRLEGASRLFRQGLGFSGPSGFVELGEQKGLWSHDSSLVTALSAPGGTSLAVAARDHGKFLQRTTLSNRPSRRGLTNRHVESDPWSLEVGFATERVPITEELALPNLHFFHRESAWEACSGAAADVARAMKARTSSPPRYYWCSWYDKGPAFSLADLRELLDGLDSLSPRPRLQAIQIDAGYCPSPGDWLMPGAGWSEGGLQAAFDLIRSRGYAAGIWVAPFMVGSRSRLFREHPEWVIRDLEGRPVPEWRNYGPESGLTDPEHYALDASHPAVLEHLRTIFRSLRQWGATVFKTDFLDWGLKDTERVARHDLTRTSVEAFRSVLQMIREEIGEDSYWLACIAPYAPCLGLADGMRVSNDAGPSWSEGSQGNLIQETLASQYFNNVFWQNDPDCVVLRDERTHLTAHEVQALALWSGILGGTVTCSDLLHRLPPERLALWRFLEPGEKATAALPFWEKDQRLKVAVRRYAEPPAWGVFFLNPAREAVTGRFDVASLVGEAEAFVWDWGPGHISALGKRRDLVVEAEGHAGALYYLSLTDSPPPSDLTIGGKRST